MKDITEYIKENEGFGHTSPAQMPNMGAIENGDIASDVGDTFEPTFKHGTDLADNPKKKKKEEEI